MVELVQGADPNRGTRTVLRRLVKLSEEAGEAAEAWLQNTSERNLKGKTDDDVREEIADTLIMALDVGLTFISRTETEEATASSEEPSFFVNLGKVLSSGGTMLSMLALAEEGIAPDMHFIRQQSARLCAHAYGMCMSYMGDKIESQQLLLSIVDTKVGKWKRQAANRTDSITTAP